MQPMKFQNPHSPSTLMMFYFAFSCCDKPPMKSSKQLAGAFVSAYKFQSITERSQSRISRQEPGGRSWGRDHREVLLTVLLLADVQLPCLLQLTCSEVALPIAGQAIPHQLAITKVLINMLTGQSDGDNSILEAILPRYVQILTN